MSIAVSVSVKPSLLLRSLFGMVLLAVATLGLWLLIAQEHALAHQRLQASALACGLWLAGIAAWLQAKALWQVRQLEFLPDGQLFLHAANGTRQKAVILSGSTFWTSCLILRLQCLGTGGDVAAASLVVAVMPDSVSAEQMRALQVACRWQQARQIDASAQK